MQSKGFHIKTNVREHRASSMSNVVYSRYLFGLCLNAVMFWSIDSVLQTCLQGMNHFMIFPKS